MRLQFCKHPLLGLLKYENTQKQAKHVFQTKKKKENLLQAVKGSVLFLASSQARQQPRRQRGARRFQVRGRPREMLHQLGRGFHEVSGGPRAAEVLVARAAEERVERVPKLVQQRFELAVREPSLECHRQKNKRTTEHVN